MLKLPFRWLLFVLLLAPTVGAQTIHVVGPGGFPTIQAAIDAAADGDVVRITPRAWSGFTVTDKGLTFVGTGTGASRARVDGPVDIDNGSARPGRRTVFAGIDFVATSAWGAVGVRGGTAIVDDCSFAVSSGVLFTDCTAVLRGCVVDSANGGAVGVYSSDLSASDCRFVAHGGGLPGSPTGALAALSSNLQLVRCVLTGGPGAANVFSESTAALHVRMGPLYESLARVFLVDCTLIGGSSGTSPNAQPAVTGTHATIRTHRSTLQHGDGSSPPIDGWQLTEVPGPLLAIDVTPAAATIGAPLGIAFRGEPGDAIAAIAALQLGAPATIGLLEQPIYGFGGGGVLGLAIADGTGAASFPIAVPNVPALRDLVLHFRGVDLARMQLQASALASVVLR